MLNIWLVRIDHIANLNGSEMYMEVDDRVGRTFWLAWRTKQ